jgi:uncharacterized protein
MGLALTCDIFRDMDREAIVTMPGPVEPSLDPDTLRAAQAFLGRLRGKYAPLRALLYGSRARGDHGPDSDVDIAVLLKGRRGDRYRAMRDMSDAAYDVLLETGILIQPLPLWEDEFERPQKFSNPALIETIRREGLRL